MRHVLARKRTIILTIALSMGLVAAGCAKTRSSSSTSAGGNGGATTTVKKATVAKPPVTLTGTVNNHGTDDATGKTAFTIRADNDPGDFYFEPTFVKVTPGQTITVTIKNVGHVQHTFTVASLALDMTVDPGKETKVEVKIPANASQPIQYHCQFHESVGMQGAFYLG